MEIVLSSSWRAYGTSQVEIQESIMEEEEGNESEILSSPKKVDSSMLAAWRNLFLTRFGSSANVSLARTVHKKSPCAYYDSTTMMSPYDLRLSFSADDALDLQRDSNMSTRIQYVPSPTILSHGDDAIRITSSPPRLLPHEILRLQPLAVAVGFDQLEDSDGRTVVIMPSQNDMNSQRNYFTESSTSRSVGTFGVRQSSSRGGKGNFRSTATATGSI